MPYADKERRRQHDRERRRKTRAGAVAAVVEGTKKTCPFLPSEPTARDVLRTLAGQINAVIDSGAEVLTTARATGYLAGVILKAIEIGDFEQRLSELEEELKRRG